MLRFAPILTVASWFLALGSLALLAVAGASGLQENLFHYQDAAVGLAFPALGWFLLRRVGSHPVGWILVVAGLSGALGAFSEEYVTVGIEAYPGSLPAVESVAWIGSWTWAFFFALLPILLLLFPDGHLLSSRWRPHLWLAGAAVVALPAVLAITSWSLSLEAMTESGDPEFPPILGTLFGVWVVAFVLSLLGALASLFLRWRRSSGIARQQLKVFSLAAAAGVGCLILSQLKTPVQDVLGVVAFLLVPVGMVAAILRYRLYDIDRIVSRTVSYAVVSAVLLALFLSSIFAFQQILPSDSDLATAASTLAVAAAFNPLRRRVQVFIDRRFNRARYDAERIADRFGRELRSRSDTVAPAARLQRLVASALEPSSVSVWMADDVGSIAGPRFVRPGEEGT